MTDKICASLLPVISAVWVRATIKADRGDFICCQELEKMQGKS